MINLISKIKLTATIAAVAFVLFWALHAYNNWSKPAVGLAVVATEADVVKHIEKVEIEVKKPVSVYGGGKKIKEKLRLPESVAADETKSVIASSTVKPDDHRQTVTTVINSETGKSETFVVREPLPWIAFSTNGEAGVYAGLLNGSSAIRAQVIQDFAQIKAVRLSGIVSADQVIGQSDFNNPIPLQTFVGVGIRYKW